MTPMSDHDLLIRVDAKIDNFFRTINDHERRLRRVELATLGVATSGIAILAKMLNLF